MGSAKLRCNEKVFQPRPVFVMIDNKELNNKKNNKNDAICMMDLSRLSLTALDISNKWIVVFNMYPRNDLNVYDLKSAKLNLALSTNSSTRTSVFSKM